MEKESTKSCPKCGCTALVLLTTLNKKICGDCGEHIPWYLEKGQKSILTNKVGGTDDDQCKAEGPRGRTRDSEDPELTCGQGKGLYVAATISKERRIVPAQPEPRSMKPPG